MPGWLGCVLLGECRRCRRTSALLARCTRGQIKSVVRLTKRSTIGLFRKDS